MAVDVPRERDRQILVERGTAFFPRVSEGLPPETLEVWVEPQPQAEGERLARGEGVFREVRDRPGLGPSQEHHLGTEHFTRELLPVCTLVVPGRQQGNGVERYLLIDDDRVADHLTRHADPDGRPP